MPNVDIGVDANINRVRLAEQGSAPSTPASGYGFLYIKADGLYFKGDNGTEIGPLSAGASMDSADPYGLHHRLDTADADDDEFSDGSIAGAWTQVDPTGSATWAESHHVLSCVFSGQASNDLGALLKASTLADGEAYETMVRIIALSAGTFGMCGLVVTDGTAVTSNAMALMLYLDIPQKVFNIEMWRGTLTSMTVSGTSRTYTPSSVTGDIRLKILRNSSTSFSPLVSTRDGAQFNAFGAAVMNPTFTPTHAGLFVTAWGGATLGLATFDYFRVIAP